LCARNIPVLVCSMHEDAVHVRRALAAGARGYITKREAPRDLARSSEGATAAESEAWQVKAAHPS